MCNSTVGRGNLIWTNGLFRSKSTQIEESQDVQPMPPCVGTMEGQRHRTGLDLLVLQDGVDMMFHSWGGRQCGGTEWWQGSGQHREGWSTKM